MSNRKKKFKMKKPTTAHEQERRRQIREKRAERKAAEKKRRRREVISEILLLLLAVGLGFLDVVIGHFFGTDAALIYLEMYAAVAILMFDNSGIRSFIFSRYPDKLPFSGKIKRPDRGQCRTVELCKTISFYSVLLYPSFYRLAFLWLSVWIICMAVTFFYLIFDEETTIRPASTPQNGLSAAGDTVFLSSLCMFLFSFENLFINSMVIVFTVVFTIAAGFLFFLVSQGRAEDEVFIFIIAAALFAFSAFCCINRDFDFSEPREYIVTVDDMRYTAGKTQRNILYVEDWHGGEDTVDISVSSETYRSIEVGDEVIIKEYSGALGVKYYFYAGSAEGED